MALTDFFRINLPYGIHIDQEGKMMAFNREYRPVGINDLSVEYEKEKTTLPVYTRYKGLTKSFLEKLSEGCQKNLDEEGKICTIWFYNDRTNPATRNSEWDRYFDKIKRLAKLQIDPRSK
ncbi:MAG: hypothetical protein R8N23_20020 [Reichenbachiella sp.]|uniref:hypothetical protein n=1 Tax=Reichenbachiella sp. TaxID=2184521 RepID=UPI002965F747|nr:hypothetical protein [Reichenbachiella sp.]MDW3212167.1 hypothetical protein [Reichenbachiella sp.]